MIFPRIITLEIVHLEQTVLLTEISKKLDLLISLHEGEEKLVAAAKKLGIKTNALKSLLEKQNQPTKE